MSGAVHHRPAYMATPLGVDNPFQQYPSSSRSVVSIRVSKINLAPRAVIPCLQSPSQLSSTVSGLAWSTQSARPSPAVSTLVGVGRGCQVARLPIPAG